MADTQRKPFHEQVAEKLIEQLKQGTAPWQRPWRAGSSGLLPINPTSGKRYKGINAIQLMSQGHSDRRWMTYKQATQAGAHVRQGEKGTSIQYWKFTEEQDKLDQLGKPVLDKDGQPIKVIVQLERPRVFFASVFNAEQIDGLPPLPPKEEKEELWKAIEQAEKILENSGALISHQEGDRAFYRLSTDSIQLPSKEQFSSADKYYATALHELGHWTGHPQRLDRDLGHPFGSDMYAKEELRAEIASMIMGDELGIGHDPEQHVAYVGSWIKALQNDPLEIFRAAADAEKIQEYIFGLSLNQEQQKEQTQEQTQEQHQGITITLGQDETYLLPSQWTGNTQVRGCVELLDENGDLSVVEASVENREPEFFGVYAENEDGLHLWVADCETEELASNLTAELKKHYQLGKEDDMEQHLHNLPGYSVLRKDGDIRDTDTSVNADDWCQTKNEHMIENQQDDQIPYFLDIPEEGVKYLIDDEDYRIIFESELKQFNQPIKKESKDIKQEKTFIKVPFAEKDEAKDLGAKWDRQKQSWYVPAGIDVNPFEKWSVSQEQAITGNPREIPQNANWPQNMYPPSSFPSNPESAEKTEESKVYLAVPFGEHKEAKSFGALWDKTAKSWYIGPNADTEKLGKWKLENITNEQSPALSLHEEFSNALISMGCIVSGKHPIMDGTEQRIAVEGDKNKETAGFYIAHSNGHPAGYIKNNRSGIELKWKSKGYTLDPEQKAAMQAEAATNLAARVTERNKAQEQAANRVVSQLKKLTVITTPTPYLAKKGIQPAEGVFTDKEGQKTYIPAIDENGKQWSMQYISEDGTKRFAKGSKKEGCFHPIGGLDALASAPILIIGEGYATAKTLAETLNFGTVAAFDAGNLKAVAIALHAKFPDKPIIIAGDDDQAEELARGRNPGKVFAKEAAQAVGGKEVFPIFAPGEQAGNPKAFSDFNDLSVNSELGKRGVERQIKCVVESLTQQVTKQKSQVKQVKKAKKEIHSMSR
ncbi:DUF1738 domain-containing protein [Yersinia enterocolitica]|nr:DUF1738 domain-containing protein [Yersinia enterocolitica]